MAQSSVFDPPGEIPNMDVEDILANIERLDRRAYMDLCYCLTEDERNRKLDVLTYLAERKPVLFETLEEMLSAYQSAYSTANTAVRALSLMYQRYLVAENTLKDSGRNLQEELSRQKKEKIPPAAKKRPHEQQRVEIDAEELVQIEQLEKTLKGREQTVQTDLFFSQEKFSDAFPLSKYVHYVKKGRKKWVLLNLRDYGIWEMIYHCRGPWQAEMLVEQLEQEGKLAIIIKMSRCLEEVMSYKVISGMHALL